MQLFSAAEIREWDNLTIAQEPITSVDLMERAADACFRWIIEHFGKNTPVVLFCGKGNNGGDGLAIARLLLKEGYVVSVYIPEAEGSGSPDFQINLKRLSKLTTVKYIRNSEDFPAQDSSAIIIDAIFGSGLNREPEGLTEELIHFINRQEQPVIAIDIPTGMFIDRSSAGSACIRARYTLSFQTSKLPFLLQENSVNCGDIVILDIQLAGSYPETHSTDLEIIDPAWIKQLIKPRNAFAHKGDFGHALLLCGNPGMMGAAILAARACLRTGCGKLTVISAWEERAILQSAVPEAMVQAQEDLSLNAVFTGKGYQAIGIGPGWGTNAVKVELLHQILANARQPLVLDADALNIIAGNKYLLKLIPQESILTPHPGEFTRLAGKTANDYDRIEKTRQLAKDLNAYIVLKGRFSFIATPSGKGFFNPTGNPGMATAGSGDVLTGILTGLMAQGLSARDTCISGVYLHGLAGDLAALKTSQHSLLAGDIVSFLGKAFLKTNPEN